MQSANSVNQSMTSDKAGAAMLQAQQELELQQHFHEVVTQLLAGPEDLGVTTAMKNDMLKRLRSTPRLFQKTLLSWIERLLTLEVDDSYLRKLHLLLSRVFQAAVQERDRESK